MHPNGTRNPIPLASSLLACAIAFAGCGDTAPDTAPDTKGDASAARAADRPQPAPQKDRVELTASELAEIVGVTAFPFEWRGGRVGVWLEIEEDGVARRIPASADGLTSKDDEGRILLWWLFDSDDLHLRLRGDSSNAVHAAWPDAPWSRRPSGSTETRDVDVARPGEDRSEAITLLRRVVRIDDGRKPAKVVMRLRLRYLDAR